MAELDVTSAMHKDEVHRNDRGPLARRNLNAEMKKSPTTRRFS
jgi:hypothetical protein